MGEKGNRRIPVSVQVALEVEPGLPCAGREDFQAFRQLLFHAALGRLWSTRSRLRVRCV